MSERNVTVSGNAHTPSAGEETRSSEAFAKPPVTILETEDGIVMYADIPAADREKLSINVEKGILTIEAPVSFEMPGKPIYSEFRLAPYFRQFSIPDTLDQEKGSAEYVNGVLRLTLPKAAAAKPRRIEVRAA